LERTIVQAGAPGAVVAARLLLRGGPRVELGTSDLGVESGEVAVGGMRPSVRFAVRRAGGDQLVCGQRTQGRVERDQPLDVALDHAEVTHPASRGQHSVLQRTDEPVVGLDRPAQCGAHGLRVCAQRREPVVEVASNGEQLARVARERVLLPGEGDRPQEGEQGGG